MVLNASCPPSPRHAMPLPCQNVHGAPPVAAVIGKVDGPRACSADEAMLIRSRGLTCQTRDALLRGLEELRLSIDSEVHRLRLLIDLGPLEMPYGETTREPDDGVQAAAPPWDDVHVDVSASPDNGSKAGAGDLEVCKSLEVPREGTQVKPKIIEVSRDSDAFHEARRISEEADQFRVPAQKRIHVRHHIQPLYSHLRPLTRLESLVRHTVFDFICALMIMFNSVSIGVGVEHLTTHNDEPLFSLVAGHCCSVFFFVELVIRVSALKWRFFEAGNRNWGIFDTLLVLFSFVEVIMSASDSGSETTSMGSGVKLLKMLRIIRVFRVFRFFKELSLLALMIVDSMRSLMWALLMLAIILYVFAIMFTSRASEYIKTADPFSDHEAMEEVSRQFGTLPRTTYTLIQAMMGGVSWGVCSDALLSVDVYVGSLFFFYVAFTILAVMNIITGVFVDNAVETARTQRDYLIQKEMELKEKYLTEMRDLFQEIDSSSTGTVSLNDVEAYLEDPRVQGYFSALGLDPHDTERLFKLIDGDGSNDVDLEEFLGGCLRLKGQARSIDIYAVMHDLRVLDDKVEYLNETLQNKEVLKPASIEGHATDTHKGPPKPQVVTITTTATAMLP